MHKEAEVNQQVKQQERQEPEPLTIGDTLSSMGVGRLDIFKELIEFRRNLAINKMVSSTSVDLMQEGRGQIVELDFLLKQIECAKIKKRG